MILRSQPLSSQLFSGIGIFILGRRLNLFTAPSPRMKEFQSAGLNFIEGLAPMMGLVPWYKYFPTPTSVRFENAVRSLQAIASQLAEERMTELKQKIESNEQLLLVSFPRKKRLMPVKEKIKVSEAHSIWIRRPCQQILEQNEVLGTSKITSSQNSCQKLYCKSLIHHALAFLRHNCPYIRNSSLQPSCVHNTDIVTLQPTFASFLPREGRQLASFWPATKCILLGGQICRKKCYFKYICSQQGILGEPLDN